MNVRAIRKSLAGILVGTLATALSVLAMETRGEPYQAIGNRNVFHLTAPTSKIETSPKPAEPPLPMLKLTGITTILGKKLAFITLLDNQRNGSVQTFVLSEGQSESGIEILQIDEKSGMVTLRNHEQRQVLAFVRVGVVMEGAPATALTEHLPFSPQAFPPN
jgi:hypothetical protein